MNMVHVLGSSWSSLKYLSLCAKSIVIPLDNHYLPK